MKIVGDYTEGFICDNLLPLYTVPSVGGEYDLLSSRELYQSNQVWGYLKNECNAAYDEIKSGYGCVFIYMNRNPEDGENSAGCAAYKIEGMTNIKDWYLDYGYTDEEYQETFPLINYRFAAALGTRNGYKTELGRMAATLGYGGFAAAALASVFASM